MREPIKVAGPLPYKDWQVNVLIGQYANNGRVSILLQDANDGMPIATASTNIVGADCSPDCIFIKDWSENEGMTMWLRRHNIVGPILAWHSTGYVSAPLVRLFSNIIKLIELKEVPHG